jgi:hypothetical protein
MNYLYQNISYAYNRNIFRLYSTGDKETTQSVFPPLIHLSAAQAPQLIHLDVDWVEMNSVATVVLC